MGMPCPSRAEDRDWREVVFRRCRATSRGSHRTWQVWPAENPLQFLRGFLRLNSTIRPCASAPYIDREDNPEDRERYQTIYARERGSVAAPTAGLHFTPAILARIRERGIETAEITLHVGLGTFQPVRGERVEDHHKLHSAASAISPD